jgi:hypothetical protein
MPVIVKHISLCGLLTRRFTRERESERGVQV